MATLDTGAPKVTTTIVDESQYASTGIAGTVPLIVFATQANKLNPSGTGIAPYTTSANASTLYYATSQRDVSQNYGVPYFPAVNGTTLYGSELAEVGLFAANNFLTASSGAYLLRADIDTAQLAASVSAPHGTTTPGTYWFDYAATNFGVFKSNGNVIAGVAWEIQTVIPCSFNDVVMQGSSYVPNSSIGSNGSYAVVVASSDNQIYEKISGTWFRVGSADWSSAKPTIVAGSANPALIASATEININGVSVNFLAGNNLNDVVSAINTANIPNITASIVYSALNIENTAGESITIANQIGTPLSTLGIVAGTYEGVQVYRTNDAQYPANSSAGSVWVKGSSTNKGANWNIQYFSSSTNSFVQQSAPFYPFDSTAVDGDPNKDAAALNAMGVPATGTLYVGYDITTGAQIIRRFDGTSFQELTYEASLDTPYGEPTDGTYWYNTDFRVDIMYGDGTKWIGYRRKYPSTDPNGVILDGSKPQYQSDGTPLVDNDLWIDTSNLENYPALYRYNATDLKWYAVDTTDQTSPFGIVFEDARQDSGVAFTGMPNAGAYTYNSEKNTDMLVSDFLDPDAPDPRTFPDGMLLFNTRYSTYNVKEWQSQYFVEGHFDPNTNFGVTSYDIGGSYYYTFPPVANVGRWVTASGNKTDGSPYMGRKAQRAMIVKAMAAAINSNQDIRSEFVYYNTIACPGYPELISEMVSLNNEQNGVAFVIGDTPCRLPPDSNSVQNWANNSAVVADNGEDGIVTYDFNLGIYYPWGLTTNVDGAQIMIPPSAIALRTFAYNDSVAYPWFAPAGYTRGMVQNASSVGYLTSNEEFKPVYLNPGQRDTLYNNYINPIAYIPNKGLVVYGQKTHYNVASALNRINVSRLCNYLVYKLDNMMKVFLFEQNDQRTRDAAKILVTAFMQDLVTKRAIYDFAVLCDLSNNTPIRIDNNELWIDVLIKPEKSIEYIYVPLRLEATGTNLSSLTAS